MDCQVIEETTKHIPYVRMGDLVIRPFGLAIVLEPGSRQDNPTFTFETMYFWTETVLLPCLHHFTREPIDAIYVKSVVR